jgi:hypothetical protein
MGKFQIKVARRLFRRGLGIGIRAAQNMPLMSALGQKRTLQCIRVMSALPPKADIHRRKRHVRFVSKADIRPPLEPKILSRKS